MPNNVSNKLKIKCQDSDTMSKIRKLVFEENKDNKNCKENNQKFTMEILLPRSMVFADSEHYDLNWNCAVWGTKWDVYDYFVNESGDTITIYYDTAWSPNRSWVEVLCAYIDHLLGYESERNIYNISVEHSYSDYPGNFGGIVEWKPGIKFEYKHYSYMEYLKNHNSGAYERMLEVEKSMKSGDGSIKLFAVPI
jgi:hypothetical protein